MTEITLVEVKPGVRFSTAWLLKTLGDRPKWVVRFGAFYHLDAVQLGALLRLTCPGVDVVQALTMEGGTHSGHLQDYVVELGYEARIAQVVPAQPVKEEDLPEGDLLTELFKRAEVAIAESIDDIVGGVTGALGSMPGKEARREIKTQLKLNRKANKFGVDEEQDVVEDEHLPNIGVLDVSASVGDETISRVVGEFVAMCVEADAWLAVVSNNTYYWKPGEYTVDAVMAVAEFGGTHYETLSELFDDRHWGVCVTLADWDSSWSAKEALADCTGSIQKLLDISLVSRPTFLAECLGQLAEEVKPLMVAKHSLTYLY